jgi:hypothetical protein
MDETMQRIEADFVCGYLFNQEYLCSINIFFKRKNNPLKYLSCYNTICLTEKRNKYLYFKLKNIRV